MKSNNSKNNNKTKTNCKNTKSNCKNSQESRSDPMGSYTGNPMHGGKNSKPVQDADDL